MKCTWDKKLIFKIYGNKDIRNELSGLLLSYIEFLDILVNYKSPVKDSLKSDYDFIKANFFIEDVISDFLTNYSIIGDDDEDYILRFTKEDILFLTSDFYNSLDEEFRDIFIKLFNKRFNHLRFTNPINSKFFSGCTFHSILADETFIASQYNKTLPNILSLIHEYAHAISFQINNSKSVDDEDNIFGEIESIFIELVALDFLEHNYPNLIDDITANRINLYNSTIEDATIINTTIDFKYIFEENLLDITQKSAIALIKLLKKETGLSVRDILYVLEFPTRTICKYTIGTLIAFELYSIYQENPKEAFKIYRRIICLSRFTNAEIFEEVKKMGINPSSHIEQFTRKLIKH